MVKEPQPGQVPATGSSYKDSGVDIDAGNRFVSSIQSLMRKTFGPEVMQHENGFGGLFELNNPANPLIRRRMKQPVLVAATDGVGTKLKIAFMTGVHNTIGIDLVAMSVNDLIVQGATPLFFLDYLATSKLDTDLMASLMEGIAEGCMQAGTALLGGETAEMPDLYAPGEYDLAGFAVGIVEKNKLIRGNHIEPGDIVIGLTSDGLHSNGFSLVRRVLFDINKCDLHQHWEDCGCTLAEELLRPTKIYVKVISSLLKSYRKKFIIHGIAHITGGGLTENLPRILPPGMQANIDPKKWEVPPVFQRIQKMGNIDKAEMFRVFNMGIGMCLVAPTYNADAIIAK
ncbi:phosphoribosylformylglycinamidine cyclo-ligase, partial [Planctomycetota bacterium]